MRQAAFTLIEVLLVAAVVATLLGMTMPAVSGVRSLAQRTACMSNQRQIGLAVLAYAGDYDDRLPSARHLAGVPNAESPAWFQRLPPYVERKDVGVQGTVFHCPVWRYQPTGTFPNAIPKSLKWNDRLRAALGQPHYRLGQWANEHEVLLLADGVAGETGMGQWGYLVPSGVDRDRHRGRVNLLACDGHSVSMRLLTGPRVEADVHLRWCGQP